MKTARSVRTIQVVVLGLLVAALLFGTVSAALADAPAPATSTAKFEVRFMEDMIDHHAMAVMEAEVCLEKPIHDELRTMCQNIITSQSQQIQLMQTWLQDWYGVAYEPEMTPGMMNQVEKLAALDGAEFEIEFMQTMIKHHRQAIKEAETCLDKAYHPELLSLCQNIIETQSAEIRQMQTWLCEWYGICKKNEMEG